MAEKLRGPTFLILGAQKSGTTWFARMLGRQPAVFIPERKELHFFTRHYGKGERWYASQFAHAQDPGFRLRGEATPNYLAVNCKGYTEVAQRIAEYRRDMRFVVLLRNPIDRALSAYFHHVMRGRFNPLQRPETHLQALLDGHDVAGILEFGRYGEQLEHYFGLFDRHQFLVLIYEELVDGAVRAALYETLRFLRAPTTEPQGPFDERLNVSPRSRGAARLGAILSVWMQDDLTRMRFGGITRGLARKVDVLGGQHLELSPEVRRRLADVYRSDVNLLRRLLARPIPLWRDFLEPAT